MKKENRAKQAGTPAVFQTLSRWYGKIPILPFLDRPTSAIFIFCITAYCIFVASILLSSPLSVQPVLSEQPLAKNTPLQLMPGETYAYAVDTPDGSQVLTYTISRDPSCAGTLVYEKETQSSLCLSSSGNVAGPLFPAMNSSYGNQSILLFAPWMLAVSDTFSWQFQNTVSAAGTKLAMPVTLTSQGRKTIAGREAFAIVVLPYFGSRSVFYIDSQKRVVLEAVSANATAKIISAPFALNWSDSANSTS